MKKNNPHWIRRILICTAIFCLTATSFGARPAQASPPEVMWSYLEVLLYPPSGGTICLNQEFDMIGKFMYKVFVTSKEEGEWARPSGETARLVQVDIKAKSGQVDPKRLFINVVGYNKWESFSFKYKATKETKNETVTVKVAMDRWVVEETTEFPVKRCEYSVHGTADIGSVVMAMSHSSGIWDFVGTYDIVGTIKPNEDGTLSGQGTTDLFTDAIFIGGGGSGCSCENTTPWQGNTTVEIEADPNAWADEGLVDLQVNLEPMPVNSTQIVCSCPGGGGYAPIPSFTVGSYDLDFDALPAAGGSTGLDFRFPQGRADFHMELIVSPEEAGS